MNGGRRVGAAAPEVPPPNRLRKGAKGDGGVVGTGAVVGGEVGVGDGSVGMTGGEGVCWDGIRKRGCPPLMVPNGGGDEVDSRRHWATCRKQDYGSRNGFGGLSQT